MSNHEHDHELEESTIVLTDEEGNEHEFELLTILELDDVNYAVLLPLLNDEEASEEDEEAIILRIDQDEEGNDVLQEIEDDEEWERVAEAYDSLADEE